MSGQARIWAALAAIVLGGQVAAAMMTASVGAQVPFLEPRQTGPPPSIVRLFTMPFAVSPQEVPFVPVPSSDEPPTIRPSSQPPATALEPRPGTGSGLISGLLPTGKMDVIHQLHPEEAARLNRLTEALTRLSQGKVSISPTLPPEISQSLSATSDQLSMLSWVASAVLTIFGLGKLGPWVVQAVSGLRSFFAARSQPAVRSEDLAALLAALNRSPAVKVAAPSSTPRPGS